MLVDTVDVVFGSVGLQLLGTMFPDERTTLQVVTHHLALCMARSSDPYRVLHGYMPLAMA